MSDPSPGFHVVSLASVAWFPFSIEGFTEYLVAVRADLVNRNTSAEDTCVT